MLDTRISLFYINLVMEKLIAELPENRYIYSNSKGLIMKRFLFACIFILLISQVAIGDDTAHVEKLLKSKLDTVLNILQKKDVTLDVKKKEIVEIVTPIFDFSLMAKLSLGKKHWTRLDAGQRKEFTDLFVQLFEVSYADKLELFDNEKVVFEKTIVGKKKVKIPTIVLSKGEKISMLYKMYLSKKGWKVYDVELEGISLIQTYRSQYRQVLETGSFEELIEKMKQKEPIKIKQKEPEKKTGSQ